MKYEDEHRQFVNEIKKYVESMGASWHWEDNGIESSSKPFLEAIKKRLDKASFIERVKPDLILTSRVPLRDGRRTSRNGVCYVDAKVSYGNNMAIEVLPVLLSVFKGKYEHETVFCCRHKTRDFGFVFCEETARCCKRMVFCKACTYPEELNRQCRAFANAFEIDVETREECNGSNDHFLLIDPSYIDKCNKWEDEIKFQLGNCHEHERKDYSTEKNSMIRKIIDEEDALALGCGCSQLVRMTA